MKLFKRFGAFVLAVVMLITILPATLTSAALYEGLMEQEDGRLAYVKENPDVPMGSVAVHSINSSGNSSDYATTYVVEEGNVIVLDALEPAMNQQRDWIGAANSKFIITDNYQKEKTNTYYEHESVYLDDEIPIEPLRSEAEGVDHTATLAEDAKEVVPGTYTYLENGKPTAWTITLGELVEPSGDDKYTIVTTKNAIVEYEGQKYLVKDGYVDTEANGIIADPEDKAKTPAKYYFINGVLHSDGVEIFVDGEAGYYLSYGRFNESFTGFVTYEDVIYYVAAGMVSSESGVFEDPAAPGTYYYVVDGTVDTAFNGTEEGLEFVNGKCVASVEEGHLVITCSDRHENTETLQNILKAMPAEPAPEAAIHNGDAVNSGAFRFADITAEFAEIFPSLQDKVFYSYGSHDSGAEECDDIEPEGIMYETDDYILYDISMNTMQDAEKAVEGAEAFTAAAADFDKNKVLFVASHMPLHTRRSDNVGAATWFSAINAVAKEMTTIVLWSHNHTGENNTDTQNYLRMPGESMTPQGGNKQKANFIYANAGYIIVGYMTQWTITDSTIRIQRYNKDGAVEFHDGITYPVVFNRKSNTLVAGDINHNESGDGESTGGSGGGGGSDSNTTSYYTTSEAEAAKKAATAPAGAYKLEEVKNSSLTFYWTLNLKVDGTYDIEQIRGSYGTSNFVGTIWSAEGNFITLGSHSADSTKSGWCNPEGFYAIVDPETMTFRPSLTAEGNPDEEPELIDISEAVVTFNGIEKTKNQYWAAYDGAEKKPEVVVTLGDATLTADDYDVEYSDNVKVGTATVTVTGKGSYTGTATGTFLITFKDVPMSHSYQKAVYWAVNEGIAAGYSGDKEGTFGINDDITRGQVVLFLWRAAGNPKAKDLTTQTFSDVQEVKRFLQGNPVGS